LKESKLAGRTLGAGALHKLEQASSNLSGHVTAIDAQYCSAAEVVTSLATYAAAAAAAPAQAML